MSLTSASPSSRLLKLHTTSPWISKIIKAAEIAGLYRRSSFRTRTLATIFLLPVTVSCSGSALAARAGTVLSLVSTRGRCTSTSALIFIRQMPQAEVNTGERAALTKLRKLYIAGLFSKSKRLFYIIYRVISLIICCWYFILFFYDLWFILAFMHANNILNDSTWNKFKTNF